MTSRPPLRRLAHLGLSAVVLVSLAACGNGAGDASPEEAPDSSTVESPGGDADDCGAAFPDLSAAPGAGEGYDQPAVTVTCAGDTMTVTSNGMIGYTFVSRTPNGLRAQDYEWTVSTSPTVAESPTSIVGRLGTLGFSVTGIPIFGPMEGPVPPAEAFGDPVYNGLLDTCGGHTGYNADYHYHTIITEAACLLDETIVGYALDGFPIYSNPGDKYESGWVKTGDPQSNAWDAYTYEGGDGTLDECNGTVADDGSYRYYATESFPYIIGCFTGTPVDQTGAAAQAMPSMNGAPNGGPPPGGGGPGGPPPTAASYSGGASTSLVRRAGAPSYYCTLI